MSKTVQPVIEKKHSTQLEKAVWSEYSNMYIHEETGDILGTDLRLAQIGDEYEVILFCGEGEPQGPIHASFQAVNGIAIIHPKDTDCGETLTLRIDADEIHIKGGNGADEWELVPRHKNFIREEHWK